MTGHYTGLTHPLNNSKGGEVIYMDTFAPDLLNFMCLFVKEEVNATQIKL